MSLTNATPTKQPRNICWSKEAFGKLSYMVVGYVTLGNFLQLAMLFFATLLSTWDDVVLNLLAAKF